MTIGADFQLDPAYQLELLKGVEPSASSIFRDVFSPEQVDTMSGSVPYIPDNYIMLGDDPSQHTSIGIQDTPNVFVMDLSTVDFNFDKKYAKEAQIHKSKVNTLAKLKGGEDLVQYLGGVAKGMVNNAIDLDGATVLKSTTLNATVSAAAQWDSGNQDVFADFDGAEDILGNIEIIWLGLNKVRELMADDAFKDEAKNYASDTGRVTRQGVVDTLKTMYGAEQVIINGTRYNESNVAQTISRARIFDDVVWCGHKDHMLVVERSDLMEADNEYNSRTGNYHQWLTEYVDIARAGTDKGVVITGT